MTKKLRKLSPHCSVTLQGISTVETDKHIDFIFSLCGTRSMILSNNYEVFHQVQEYLKTLLS